MGAAKMGPRECPERPSIKKYLEMLSGPKVDISVGVGDNKNHYPLSKHILCHYSPFFDKCFNGAFKEGQTQALELPEDSILHFELLIEFIMSGAFSKDSAEIVKETWDIKTCMEFIQYTHKYDLGAISTELVYDSLRRSYRTPNTLKGEHIELVFAAVPEGNRLRRLIAEVALEQGIETYDKFAIQERQVDGFAAEVLEQIRVDNSTKRTRR